jgi:hypothetical protein
LGIKFTPKETIALETDYAAARGFSACSNTFSKIKEGVQSA